MTRQRFFFAVLGLLVCCGLANAQSPGVLYTWAGTGNIRDWIHDTSQPDFTVLSNTTAGQLTVTEVGDEFDPGCIASGCPVGGAHIFSDSWDLIREGTAVQGGIDLTGLQFVEMDISHNGTGNVSVQPFIGTGQNSTYTWFGPAPDYTPGVGLWTIPPGSTPTTVRIPVSQLTPAQQAYTRLIGVKVFDHVAQGYLTWTISEARSTGTPLTQRDLATHDVGSSDNGLNGAYVNYGNTGVLGNDGGQNQTGLSQNTSGSGSLQWTTLGTHGVGDPSGGAITWGNGTSLPGGIGNGSFYERPADFSNYNHVTVRMSATDVTPGGGGSIGVQAFFEDGNYEFFETTSGGTVNQYAANTLPVDGQFHDLIFPLNNVPHRGITPAFGISLFSHTNDVVVNVDLIHFSFVAGVPGDYNGDGTVNIGDYVLWRKNAALQSEIASLGTDTPQDYTEWRARFGNNTVGGSGSLGGGAVPEPASMVLLISGLVAQLLAATNRKDR